MSARELLQTLVGQKSIIKIVTAYKILAAAGDYGAEDVISESASIGTPFVFENMARKEGGTGEIIKAQVFCSKTGLIPRITLYLFSKIPTTNLLDNVANAAPSVADYPTCEGQLDFPGLEDLGGGSMTVITPSTIGNVPLPYKCIGTSLYGIAVTRDAITGEAVGMSLNFKLQIRQD